ncbi:MAG TPA: TIM-barrel domain-containing protein [Roseiarcus sp.]|nr:TIM-barrel domain-containing protein [Roseiarcus sp.]
MDIAYTSVRDFTPNHGDWTQAGAVTSVQQTGATFSLGLGGGLAVSLSFLSPRCFRVRFNPAPGTIYGPQASPAVVQPDLGPVNLAVAENSPARLVIDTGTMRVQVNRQPYRVQVFRGTQLISADTPSYNMVYIPGHTVIANFKLQAPGANYFGFGEKAGAQLAKNQLSLTQFNYDNYKYNAPTVPSGTSPGPLNPSDALYATIPFMLEINRQPGGDFAGPPYACGLFFDNTSQSYFNLGSNDYSDMDGKFYFGALFGDLDYYFFLGDGAPDVLSQYTTLTGRAPMPPKYVLGYHQGAYGYYDRQRLESVANAYRSARIPCDGLHIDVDFQDNYRTFTHSEIKFPDAPAMLAGLHAQGFKCSTIITPFLTNNPLDETGRPATYAQRRAILAMGGLIYNTYAGQGPSAELFLGGVNYGENFGLNPYMYPPYTCYAPLKPNPDGVVPLTSPGNYPDLGRVDVRAVWGQQCAHLIEQVGMDMIWQDMMCPALDGNRFENGTFPLTLMVNDGATYVPNGVSHNSYSLFLAKATSEGLAKLRPDTRNFIIARGGYAGMQRYAALWTGDSASSWDFLAINLPEVLNLGLSGVPISGCDIGGFADGSGSTPQGFNARGQPTGNITNCELLTRWMHLGSFLPWYRNHYNGYNKAFQEPYRYGEPVPTNCRKYVELRYRMLQVYYDALYEWTQTGLPLARALFLNDPDDPQVYQHLADQFFVGRDVLVAPILFPAQQQSPAPVATRSVYLPAGSDWYAFTDNTAPLELPVAGGTLIADYYAGLDLVPIYVRAGAILPMRSQVEQYVGELAQNPLDIAVYPGRDADYVLYQDDGISTQAQNAGAFRTTRISQRSTQGARTVRLTRLQDRYAPAEPYLLLRLLQATSPSAVSVGGVAVPQAASQAALAASAGDGFYFDEGLAAVVVKVMDSRPQVSVEVRL